MALEGIRFLDHTADVGVEAEGPSLEVLLHRCALAMLALIRGDEEDEAPTRRPVTDRVPLQLESDGPVGLLAAWLREVLYLHDGRDLDYVDVECDAVSETAAGVRILATPAAGAVREIKGVTYHQLTVEPTEGGWRARVIFDV